MVRKLQALPSAIENLTVAKIATKAVLPGSQPT
jgi:hypothetical protein